MNLLAIKMLINGREISSIKDIKANSLFLCNGRLYGPVYLLLKCSSQNPSILLTLTQKERKISKVAVSGRASSKITFVYILQR